MGDNVSAHYGASEFMKNLLVVLKLWGLQL